MNVEEYMKKRGLTDEVLDKMAAPYERGDYELSEGGEIHRGSHLDAVGKKRVTVIYSAQAAQRVNGIARSKGVNPSDVYRDALDYYLAVQA